MGVGMPSRIVDRYKTLICSIAYSATGNLSQSEDVAQETFISAWKDLRHLREPSKLRAWLCGIVRNQIQRDIRKGRRDPVQNAVLLEDASKSPTADELPSAQAVSREEEAILWRSLERIPENYREPLVLFYRERKSVEHVAAELELSEDAVRQRLSRGRKLLQEEVQAFVENTLRRTAPGQAFSGDVIGALPLATGTAASASIGIGAKGKAAALSGLLSAWIVPLLGIAAGFASQWVLFRGGADERGHRANRSPLIVAWVLVLSFCFGGQQIMRLLGNHFEWDDRTFFCAMSGFWLFYAMVIATWIISVYRRVQAATQQGREKGEERARAAAPMNPFTRMLVMVGTNLMVFTSVILLSWSSGDRITARVIAAIMLLLSAWHSLLFRGKIGSASVVTYIRQIASSCGVVLLIINLRFDVWAAARYGVTVGEVRRMLPIGLVPFFTLFLVIWAAAFLFLTRKGSYVR
jgi:RNA polymerase sigma factor (sigma-70 family)